MSLCVAASLQVEGFRYQSSLAGSSACLEYPGGGRKNEKGRKKNEKGLPTCSKLAEGFLFTLREGHGPTFFLLPSGKGKPYVLSRCFRPLGRKREKGRKKNEEHFAKTMGVGREFSIFIFPSSFFPVVSVPLRGNEI